MSKRSHKLFCFVGFVALLLIYLAFPTRSYYYDGVFFARAIEEAPSLKGSLLHPNHLIYTPVGYLAYRVSQMLGFNARALHVLQVLNSFVAVGAAYVLFRILRESFHSRYLAWCLTLLFALSATWWKFSIDADAYIISVLFLLVSFYLILPGKTPRPWLLVATFSLAVVFHQLAVLFFFVILLGLFWQTPAGLPTHKRMLRVLQFGLGSFLLIFSSYCLGFYFAAGTFEVSRFARWITSYSPDVSFSFDVLSNLRYTLRGHARLFFGGRFNFIGELLETAWMVLVVVAVALIAVLMIQLIRGRGLQSESSEKLRLDNFARLCVLWVVTFVLFLFFWLPHNTFYRLFYLPAIILLAGWVLFRRLPAARGYRLALFVAIMVLANFLFSILPYSRVENNRPLALALALNEVWPAGTVIYYASENSDNNLVRYFNRATEWRPLPDISRLETELKTSQAQGKTNWLETTAIDQILGQPDGETWLATHVKAESRRELIDRAHRIRFLQITPTELLR